MYSYAPPYPSSSTSPSYDGLDNLERKLKKPLMEKRRRERINSSLDQIKALLMHSTTTQSSKLEKADILEMAVDYIKRLEDEARGNRSSCSKEEAAAYFKRGYTLAWETTGRYAQQYLCQAFPPQSGPQAQQFHLEFVNMLRQIQNPPASTIGFQPPNPLITTAKLVSPIPAGGTIAKFSPATPESAYGSSPEADTSLGSTRSTQHQKPTTPVARPRPIDVVETDDDDDDSHSEAEAGPSPAKKAKLWRPF
ncbi:unnamed protein product, partial [Mesorhabditis spiculigera]